MTEARDVKMDVLCAYRCEINSATFDEPHKRHLRCFERFTNASPCEGCVEEAKELRDFIRDAGFAVVPVEPTDGMWLAGDAEFLHSVNSIWRAMVAAALKGYH